MKPKEEYMKNHMSPTPKRISRLLLTGLLSASTLAYSASQTITLGDLSWEEPQAVNAILKKLLEDNFDVKVGSLRAEQGAIFQAMSKGDGSVDVHPAVWESAQSGNIKKFVEERKTVRLNTHPYEPSDGWYVPAYVAKNMGIKSVSDLLDKDVAAKFDLNHDGKGDYWPGAEGWGVTKIYEVKAKSQGIDEYYEKLGGGEALFKAQFEKAYKSKAPVLFYWYEPTALPMQFDMVRLEEPPFDGYAMDSKKDDPDYNKEGCYNYYPPESGADWKEKSSITCQTPKTKVYIAYSASLEKRAPKVAGFLKNASFTIPEVEDWIYKLSVGNMKPDQVADQWVEANQDKVKSWIQ